MLLATMATKPIETAAPQDGIYRGEWPRVRTVSVRGVEFFQCDGRPHYPRKIFSSLIDARKQANKWENARTKYGTAGKFISEKDASRFAEALEILRPHGAGIIDAARHFAAYLEMEKRRASSKPVAEALREWVESYATKDRDDRTRQEIKSVAGIFSRAFGALKLSGLTPELLMKWIEGYETQPGKLASPQTRANLRTKLSQFLNFSKLKVWIENNPLEGIKMERPPRAAVAIFDIKQVNRLIEAADKSESRELVLPYVALCLFAGLRPNSEAEQIKWKDIHFATGDIHVRAETSKTREERFVPMEGNLIAWLETCPIRNPGSIIGTSHGRFREAWEEVKRVAGYKVGSEPEQGWPAMAQEWPADAMRHTYASMWLAVHKSRSELAERMGNSEATIKSHYRRAIREDVAKAFWGIMPKVETGAKILRMEGAA
jgi:integrase